MGEGREDRVAGHRRREEITREAAEACAELHGSG